MEIVPEVDKSKVTPIRKRHKPLQRKEKLPFVNRQDLLAILTNEELDTTAKLACWLAVPTGERYPKHQKELAKLLGVHESILSRLKNTPEFTATMTECSRNIAAGHTGAVLKRLYERCMDGSVPAMELFLNKVDRWEEKQQFNQGAITNIAIMINGKPANSLPVGIVDRPKLKAAEG